MLNTVIVTVVVASSTWVYLDATRNKIGKTPGAKSMFNMSAGSWALVTLLLWIVGFPAYLAKRKALIEQAKENPVEVSGRSIKAAALSIVGGLLVLLAFSGAALSGLPACDSSDTRALVEQIIDDMPVVRASGAQFVAIKDIVEQGYNERREIRACSATLVTTAGENTLQYRIRWDDKARKEFSVEAQIH